MLVEKQEKSIRQCQRFELFRKGAINKLDAVCVLLHFLAIECGSENSVQIYTTTREL
jgi:hypothetical protein